MPHTQLLEDGTLEMNYIPGQEGTQGIDFSRFGQIVRQLHELDILAPPKDTGIHWLFDMARANLSDNTLDPILSQLVARLPDDAVVHGEIAQVIATPDGNLFIIDWDECGLGSKYHDLGFVYYTLALDGRVDECYAPFLDGYGAAGLDSALIPQVAGLIATAYAGFGDRERRLHIGRDLLHI
jgi:aminoglycoside phosphotransferase